MDRATWLESRRHYLGASEVAAVCGLDPFRTPLDVWASKKGLLKDAPSIAADMGNLFEAPLLGYYAQRNRRTLMQPGTVTRPDCPWMAATPDAVTTDNRNVQVKVVGRYMAALWDSQVPDHVQAQVQWEMWVTGLTVTDVVACIGGTDYRELMVDRHQGAIDALVSICSEFWERYIVGSEMPSMDGKPSTREILAALYPNPTAGMEDAPAEVVQLAAEHHQIGKLVKAQEAERERIGNELRRAIKERAGLKWDGGYVSWKPNSAGQRVLRVQIKE